MSTFHTSLEPGVSVQVTLPGDARPDHGTHVFVYWDGSERKVVPSGTVWSAGGHTQRTVIEAEALAHDEWRDKKMAVFNAAKEVFEGMFADAPGADQLKLEAALAEAETRELLIKHVEDWMRKKGRKK